MTKTKLPSLIPAEVLFGNPERTQPRISPDGKLLAYLAPLNGVLNVWMGPVGGEDFEPVTNDEKRGIRVYSWAEDGRHLIYLQDKDGDENWRLYAVQPGSAARSARDLTPFDDVQARPLKRSKRSPEEALIELNKRDPRVHDVHRLNLATGNLELIAKNPGDIAGWVADESLAVRAALSATSE